MVGGWFAAMALANQRLAGGHECRPTVEHSPLPLRRELQITLDAQRLDDLLQAAAAILDGICLARN
jgi:hypothetical protein